MATRTDSCEARLPEHLASRLDDFRSMVGWLDAWAQTNHHGRQDTAQERLDNYPLAVDVRYSVRVELSTGGPADYLVAEVDGDGEVRSIAYHFADWFDHAAKVLDGDDFTAAERYIARTLDLSSLSMYVSRDRDY